VDQSRWILLRPACGERVGVRGVLATAQHPQVALPLTRSPRRARLPTSPRKRGEVMGGPVNSFTGWQAAAIAGPGKVRIERWMPDSAQMRTKLASHTR